MELSLRGFSFGVEHPTLIFEFFTSYTDEADALLLFEVEAPTAVPCFLERSAYALYRTLKYS